MLGFLVGVAVTVAVSIFFPVTYAKFVTYVRGFWEKSREETEVK